MVSSTRDSLEVRQHTFDAILPYLLYSQRYPSTYEVNRESRKLGFIEWERQSCVVE